MQGAAADAKRSGALQTANDTYKKLKEDLLRSRRAVNVLTGADAAKVHYDDVTLTFNVVFFMLLRMCVCEILQCRMQKVFFLFSCLCWCCICNIFVLYIYVF